MLSASSRSLLVRRFYGFFPVFDSYFVVSELERDLHPYGAFSFYWKHTVFRQVQGNINQVLAVFSSEQPSFSFRNHFASHLRWTEDYPKTVYTINISCVQFLIKIESSKLKKSTLVNQIVKNIGDSSDSIVLKFPQIFFTFSHNQDIPFCVRV